MQQSQEHPLFSPLVPLFQKELQTKLNIIEDLASIVNSPKMIDHPHNTRDTLTLYVAAIQMEVFLGEHVKLFLKHNEE